jgi:hypothetical protein
MRSAPRATFSTTSTYRMSFARGVWKLWRTSADLSPLDFSQRFEGSFSEDGTTIEGGRSPTTALPGSTTSTRDARGSRNRGPSGEDDESTG